MVVYSSNKEDIWVSRIPIPVIAPAALPIIDNFDTPAAPGIIVPNWNVYSPLWAPVQYVQLATPQTRPNPRPPHVLELSDRDPHDYARADRIFQASKKVTVQFTAEGDIHAGGRT